MGKYVLGVDVGTTGSKAMVMDLKGKIYGQGYREYTLNYPKKDWVEIGARFLLDITNEAIKEAVDQSGLDKKEIEAVSFSVQRSTFCLFDQDMNVIDDKFYVWLDSRAEEIMEELNSKMDPDTRNAITGLPGANIYEVDKLYWLMKKEPETYKKIRYVSTVMGYVMYEYGADEFVDEYTNGVVTGLCDVRTHDWCWDLIDACGFDRKIFPKLCMAGDVVGCINEKTAAATGLAVGTRIVAGSGDQQLSAMGRGVLTDGDVCLIIGTYGNIIVGSSKPDFVALKGMMIPPTPNPSVFEVEGAQVSGATCYRWCRDIMCEEDVKEAEEQGIDPFVLMGDKYIKNSVPGSNGVIFYSALFGSGFPTWDTYATGMFLGLRSTSTKADMVRAVMEGITLEARHVLTGIEAAGVDMNEVLTVAGGVAKSPEWLQIIADVMGRKIRTLKTADTAIIGAGIMAAIALGEYKDTAEGVANMVEFGDVIEPIPENVALYEKSFEAYKAAYYGLKSQDVFKKLADIR